MIKSIFAKESLAEACMQTCGYVSRGVKKEISGMRDLAFRLKLSYITMNQYSVTHESDAFIVLPLSKMDSMFVPAIRSKFDYIPVINGKIIRYFEPVNVLEECSSFPFLQIDTTRSKKIELYHADEKMDVKNQKFENGVAINIQAALDTLKGLSLINPLRHKGTLRIKPGYERLLPHTQAFLQEFREKTSEFSQKSMAETNESIRKMRFVSLNSAATVYLEESTAYAELKSRLLADYRTILQLPGRELKLLIDDPNSSQAQNYLSLLSSFDIGN